MKVQGNAVLILPEDNPEMTKSGIITPKVVREQPNTGIVVDKGDLAEGVNIGDRVYYNRRGVSVINIDDIEHHFTSIDRILIVL